MAEVPCVGLSISTKTNKKQTENKIKKQTSMKKYSMYLCGAMCTVAVALSAGSFIKAYATPASVAVAGQPVDLTYAAEKSLPAVVHIKFVQN